MQSLQKYTFYLILWLMQNYKILLFIYFGLSFEHLSLHNRIIQLGITVTELFVAAEQLESLSQAGLRSMAKIENKKHKTFSTIYTLRLDHSMFTI